MMKTFPLRVTPRVRIVECRPLRRFGWAAFLALTISTATGATHGAQTFAAPEEAVAALVAATHAKDTNALQVLFGDAAAELVNPDQVQAGRDLLEFTSAFNQAHRIVRTSESHCVLQVGETSWPFPLPIVGREGTWSFDVEAGKDELLNRRIGGNELATLETLRAYVATQREYAAKDRDGDEVLEYAQKIRSTPGLKDGLYWPPEIDGEISPLGPAAAAAQARGYFKSGADDDGAESEPFQGYFFKVLTRQGPSAPGGRYDYIINGNMIGGFALVAWPAVHGNTGIMTFIINQQGRVYEKDLGSGTARKAAAMKSYAPDRTWRIAGQ